MKKLTKIMLSVAAATVVTAAMAVTAMAVDTITGTYNNETGVVTMNDVIGSGSSQTILVLDNATEDIAYINQIDNNGTFSSFVLAPGLKPNVPNTSVTYNIKIGGTDKSVQTGTLTIAGDAPATVKIIIGDVSGDGEITASDLTQFGRYVKGKTTNLGLSGQVRTKPDGTTVIIGDVSGDGEITASDLTQFGRYVKGKTTNLGLSGQEVEVLKPASAE